MHAPASDRGALRSRSRILAATVGSPRTPLLADLPEVTEAHHVTGRAVRAAEEAGVALAALGVASIDCAGDANLSGIGGVPGELCVAQASQQTVLRIDEEGTVAAALTEIGAEASAASAAPDRQLHLDRPFLFQIAHSDTDWVLFAAAIRDPRS